MSSVPLVSAVEEIGEGPPTTDMVEGKMVVLESGDVSIAMRASMSVPGAFSPVIIDEMILTDGGQLRNLPVDVGRDLCGGGNVTVIAVSLQSPPPDPTNIDEVTVDQVV